MFESNVHTQVIAEINDLVGQRQQLVTVAAAISAATVPTALTTISVAAAAVAVWAVPLQIQRAHQPLLECPGGGGQVSVSSHKPQLGRVQPGPAAVLHSRARATGAWGARQVQRGCTWRGCVCVCV